jgi:hypothetical protein
MTRCIANLANLMLSLSLATGLLCAAQAISELSLSGFPAHR